MSKFLIVLTALFVLGCSSVSFKEMAVNDILLKTQRNMHVWASTEFVVKSTGVGIHSHDKGIWFLNSAYSYRSSESLNVRLSTQVVEQFKRQYKIDDIAELRGKKIQVVGTATPEKFCLKMGCPKSPGIARPTMYIQTQLKIEDLSNIRVL